MSAGGHERLPGWVTRALAVLVSLAALAGLVVLAYAVVVLVLGHVPTASDRTLLAASALASVVVALAYGPVRARLARAAARITHGEHGSPTELLRAFDRRLTRPMALDEFLLQLAESLRLTLGLEAAEVWIGSDGLLERAASDPDRGDGSVVLTPTEGTVLAGTRLAGRAWLQTWLPQLAAGRDQAALRIAPITNAGELLGIIVAERAAAAPAFAADEEDVLAALAAQVGLAVKTVRLGSALDASLDELRRQAAELRASRSRVVAAADEERRRIERDLHDGAQQNLVALAVNVRLARQLAESDPPAARAALAGLSADVQEALDELRDLARGIYPPLLVEHGLWEGLGVAVANAPIPARLEIGRLGRYGPELETTVYFCCVEALQNAAKHAGEGTRASVRVWEEQTGLCFEVSDDGAGFAPAGTPDGTGFANLRDRLGALGGHLSVESAPGAGTRVVGALPLGR